MNKIIIDWNFGNTCDLKCNYCNKELYDGANPFPTLDNFGPAFDHLINQTQGFSHVQLEFSGGEPSQSEAMRRVILSNADERVKFKINSNAQAPVEWWSNIAHKLYESTLTYHSSTEFEHFLRVVYAVSNYIRPKIQIPLTPDTWDLTNYRTLKSLGCDVHLQLLYSNFTRGNNEYLKYTDQQWEEYYKEQGIDIKNIVQVEKTVEFKRVNNLNNFYGHLCWAGYNQIIIDNFGYVYRGWCKSGNDLGNVFKGTVELLKQPGVCPKQQCRNGFDLSARKSENSWGFA